MKLKFQIKFILLLLIFISKAYSQGKKSKMDFEFNGYIKYMSTTMFGVKNQVKFDNLIHNRLNFKAYFNEDFKFVAEVRNRAIWGYSVKNIPGYDQLVDMDNNEINMSFFIVNNDNFLLHTNVERLYLDYNFNSWEVQVGRQRINWGKNLVWNPNDLFNAYNFIDFDYEERPGTDAVRVQYNTSDFSNVEIAYAYGKELDRSVLAAKYLFQLKNYELQVLAGSYYTDYAVGAGWEGSIKNAGFKGEATYFIPKASSVSDKSVLATSMTVDYYFKNGVNLAGSFLYNSGGVSNIDQIGIGNIPFANLSAKNLMPNKFSLFGQVSKMFTPAINGTLATIYAMELQTVFIMPNFTYSIKDNFDLDVIAQLYVGSLNQKFDYVYNSMFIRLRWSF